MIKPRPAVSRNAHTSHVTVLTHNSAQLSWRKLNDSIIKAHWCVIIRCVAVRFDADLRTSFFFILFPSLFTYSAYTRRHLHTSRCSTLLALKTHTPLRKHTQSGCKCRWEEIKAAVVLWFHLLVYYIYLTLSCVYCSLLTRWLFHQHFGPRCGRGHPTGDTW